MELFLVILIVIALFVGYFCLGIFVKFIVGWWILTFGTPMLLIIGLGFGWFGAIVAISGFIVLLFINNRWHDTEFYLSLERKIDKAFYLSDT